MANRSISPNLTSLCRASSSSQCTWKHNDNALESILCWMFREESQCILCILGWEGGDSSNKARVDLRSDRQTLGADVTKHQ